MTLRGVVPAFVFVCLFASPGSTKSQTNKSSQPRSDNLQVAPDLHQRLARFRQVQMPFHPEGLSAREKKMVLKLVDASRCLDDIYWRQVDPEALELYESLEGSSSPRDAELRRYLWINGSR